MALQLLCGGRASNSIYRQKIDLARRRRASMRQGRRFGSQSWNSGKLNTRMSYGNKEWMDRMPNNQTRWTRDRYNDKC